MSVELRGLDQAHDGGGALTGAQRTGEEPVGSSEGNRPDSIFDMVIVDRQIAILEVADQGCPAPRLYSMAFALAEPSGTSPRWRTSHCRKASAIGFERCCRSCCRPSA
jgi:hypothetical protein